MGRHLTGTGSFCLDRLGVALGGLFVGRVYVLDSVHVGLGALPSEIDEPDVLPESFAALQAVTENIVHALREGSVGEEEAAGLLQGLRLHGEDGFSWCVGASSLRWYRKEGEGPWRFGIPPAEASDAHRESLQVALAAVPEGYLGEVVESGFGYGDFSDESGGVDGLDPWATTGEDNQVWGFSSDTDS